MPRNGSPPELPDDLTIILNSAARGDSEAAERAWSAVYDELRATARRVLGTPRLGERHVPGPTTVVHEAFLRVNRGNGEATAANGSAETPGPWDNRRHFFGAIARSMVQFLIDHRRANQSLKRGGFARTLPLGLDFDAITSFDDALAKTDAGIFEALQRLEQHHPTAAEVVWMRYICGLSIEQTSDLLGIAPRTVCKHWNYARSWLRRELTERHGRDLPEAPSGGNGEGAAMVDGA